MRRCVALLSGLSLIAGSLPAAAQTGPMDPTQKFNAPLETTDCIGQVAGGDPYPFSVAAVRNALTGRGQEVNVLVVDNNFFGYDLNERADSPNDPVRVSSKNFPSDFFNEQGSQDDFSPFVGTSSPPADVADESAPLIELHGTFVTGIVLGGMYDDNQAPPGAGLRKPSVRNLLLYRNSDKSWLRISFLIIKYGDGAEGDPVDTLNRLGPQADTMSIVNMSLAKALSGSEDIAKLNDKQSLIVTSAGNSGLRLSRSQTQGIVAIPAALPQEEQLLVVASHDADGRLSSFSNYGPLVNIAAPGCQIKSWGTGDGDPRTASGTSMATAIVTFAAALVRSQWSQGASATAIRNRILSSARFNPWLQRCDRLPDSTPATLPPDSRLYCVEDGAMLDITAAVSVGRDLVEFDECGSPAAAGCKPTLALGTLQQQAGPLLTCLKDEDIPTKVAYQGLTKNGAAKRTGPDTFLIDWEHGFQVGELKLESTGCTLPPGSGDSELLFQVEGSQPDPRSHPSTDSKHIKLKDLRRLVMRSI